MRIDEPVTESQAVSGDTFLNCPCLQGRAKAAGIANPHSNFDPAQSQFGKAKFG